MIASNESQNTDKSATAKIFFQYPDALHEFNGAMATGLAEIPLAWAHLPIFCGRFQTAVAFCS